MLEEKHLVSIIMPAYNAAKTIKQSIESVLAQTYENWELIVVNDCSSDDTESIIKEYAAKDKRIVSLTNEQNSGVVATRNVAIKKAAGKYIAFLDSDDLWLPNKLETQIKFMKEKNIAFCFSNYECVNESGKSNGKVVQVPSIITHKQLLKNTIIGCLTVLIDKEVVGNFEMPDLKHGEDIFTWYSILKKGYLAYGIKSVLAKYRVSNSSLSGNKIKSARLYWFALRKHAKLSFFKSVWCFFGYAFNAIKKRI